MRIIFGQLKTDAFNEGQNAFDKMMNQISVRAKGSKRKRASKMPALQN